MPGQAKSLLALDVGARRIGVAVANEEVMLAHPLTTLEHTETVNVDILRLIKQYNVTTLVIGLPRGLEGQETAQTKVIRDFAKELEKQVPIPLVFQDEALTSAKAETELNARGKVYSKGDVDALAATYILEDYIVENPRRSMYA